MACHASLIIRGPVAVCECIGLWIFPAGSSLLSVPHARSCCEGRGWSDAGRIARVRQVDDPRPGDGIIRRAIRPRPETYVDSSWQISAASAAGLPPRGQIGRVARGHLVIPLGDDYQVVLKSYAFDMFCDFAFHWIITLARNEFRMVDVFLKSAEFSATFWQLLTRAHSRRATVR